MPELPEVQTIVSDLQKILPGAELLSIQAPWPKSAAGDLPKMRRRLLHHQVDRVDRLGKSLVVVFGEAALHIHLKMTGQLIWQSPKLLLVGGHPIVGVGSDLPNKFSRLIFSFDRGRLFFNDVRKFGWVKLVDAQQLSLYADKLGLEPVDKRLSAQKLRNALSRRGGSKIKAALLDQGVVSGLGNIYVDEVLFASGIKPDRLVKSLRDEDYSRITSSIVKILKSAIKYRGTSFSDYLDAQGSTGRYAQKLKVYGRSGLPCVLCGQPLRKGRLSGRGTHWCINCQK